MKNRINILTLVLGLAPGFALAQAVTPTTPPTFPTDQQQRTDRDRTIQDQQRDDQDQIRHDRDDQQRRPDRDYDKDRWSRRDAGNLNDSLHDRFPNTNISANFQDDHTVVLTGTAATGHDRKDAVEFVQSQVGNARVVDQIQVTGYGRGGNPNPGDQNPTANYPRTDRDRDSRMPQSDVQPNTYPDRDNSRDEYKDKDKDKHKDKMKDKDKDRDRDNDSDQVPH